MNPLVLPSNPANFNGYVFYFSRPNRYATANNDLLAGPAGDFLKDTIRSCGVDPAGCIFTSDLTYSRHTDHNYSAIYLGTEALVRQQRIPAGDFTKTRGLVSPRHNGEWITTFDPIDCVEVVSHEHYGNDDDDLDDEDPDTGTSYKDSAPTSRSNYRFWFKSDLRKLLCKERRLSSKYAVDHGFNTEYLVKWLNSQTDQILFFDIETHPPTNSVQCFSIATATSKILMVPCYDHRGTASLDLPRVFSALARCFSKNTICGHNIMFDLGFLFHFHGVPFGQRMIDTMLIHHRCFPESEKSLSHAISYWINKHNHKDEAGTFTPYNHKQFFDLQWYNANDVGVLRDILVSQMEYVNKDPGLMASVADANSAIYPYLLASVTGMELSLKTVRDKQSGLAKQLTDLKRVLACLTGREDFNPASNKHIQEWLFDGGLGYPVLEKTATEAPATDMATLYRLIIKFPSNVALKLLIMFKELAKVDGMLGFEQYYVNESRSGW